MLDSAFKADLETVIRDTVRVELEKHKHTCRFDVTDKDAEQFGNHINALRDLGDGKVSGGIKAMRENHEWVQKARERGEKVASAAIYVIVYTFVGGVIYALWEWLKTKLVGG